jgi:hypothetical protein
VPVESHVCTALPEHCSVPGVHTPTQPVFTHAELVHSSGLLQLPLESQVCTPLPEHCVAPGTQVPTQLPETHAEATH